MKRITLCQSHLTRKGVIHFEGLLGNFTIANPEAEHCVIRMSRLSNLKYTVYIKCYGGTKKTTKWLGEYAEYSEAEKEYNKLLKTALDHGFGQLTE